MSTGEEQDDSNNKKEEDNNNNNGDNSSIDYSKLDKNELSLILNI